MKGKRILPLLLSLLLLLMLSASVCAAAQPESGEDGRTDDSAVTVLQDQAEDGLAAAEIPGEPLPSRLPAMGMLWWALPTLAVGGILLAVVGWKRHERGEQDGAD